MARIKPLRKLCAYNLHEMVPGAFKVELLIDADTGKEYLVRRCIACRNERLKNYMRKKEAADEAETG